MTEADDHALAHDLAERAGRLLLDLRAQGGDPDALKNAGDRQSHEFLMAELAKARPDDAVLSEEGIDDKARLTADRVWIVDPLDGTREFGEPGRTDWAVHVALWQRTAVSQADAEGEASAAGACRRANRRRGSPARQGHRPLHPRHRKATGPEGRFPPTFRRSVGGNLPLRVGRAAPPPAGRQPHQSIPAGQGRRSPAQRRPRPLRISRRQGRHGDPGENDVYLHSGGFYEWDTAAPVAVARAAGLHVSRIDGSDVAYNQENPLLPDILVCRPAIAGLLLNAIREATHAI